MKQFGFLYEPARCIEEIERDVYNAVSAPVIEQAFNQWDQVYSELVACIKGDKNPQRLQFNETGLLAISFYESLFDFLVRDNIWIAGNQAEKYRDRYDEFKKQLDVISQATFLPDDEEEEMLAKSA